MGRARLDMETIEYRLYLGEKIRIARKKKKLKQCELAAAVGITSSQLCRIEKLAGHMDVVLYKKIVDALGEDWGTFLRS